MAAIIIYKVSQLNTVYWNIKIIILNSGEKIKTKNNEPVKIDLAPGEYTLQAQVHWFWYSKPLKIKLNENDELELVVGSYLTFENANDLFFPYIHRKSMLFLDHKEKKITQHLSENKRIRITPYSPLYYLHLITATAFITLPFFLYMNLLPALFLVLQGIILLVYLFIITNQSIASTFSQRVKLFPATFFLIAPYLLDFESQESTTYILAAACLIILNIMEISLSRSEYKSS